MRECSWKWCFNLIEETPRRAKAKNVFCDPKCKNKFYVDKRRKEVKRKSIEYLGGKCVRCGFIGHQAAMVPHHTNPLEKEYGISYGGHTRSWDRVRVELDKCILLCANCHLIVHATNEKEYFHV
jgi:5-methylcytosine-specific restriction endonuclease McrA